MPRSYGQMIIIKQVHSLIYNIVQYLRTDQISITAFKSLHKGLTFIYLNTVYLLGHRNVCMNWSWNQNRRFAIEKLWSIHIFCRLPVKKIHSQVLEYLSNTWFFILIFNYFYQSYIFVFKYVWTGIADRNVLVHIRGGLSSHF